jgi:hypothetical protein
MPALAPVVQTVMLPTPRGTQCWAARTIDGVWDLERDEDRRSDWAVTHRATQIQVNLLGSLRDCRAYVASGGAAEDLGLIQAHERGAHAVRVPRCRRC